MDPGEPNGRRVAAAPMKALTYDEWRRLHPKEPAPFVIYDRFSSDLQDTSSGTLRQGRCREYAVKNNIRVLDVYYDEAKSGTSTETRKRYRQLLADAFSQSRKFVGILVFSSSRWGRATDSEIDFLMLEVKGIRIVSATEAAFQQEGSHGELMRGILQKVNAFFSRQTGEYTHAMQTANCQEGFMNGGGPPDGYVAKPFSLGMKDARGEERFRYLLELNEKPGPYDTTSEPRWRWVRIAVDMHLKQGRSVKSIVRELYARGFRGLRKGTPLNPSNVRAAFRNGRYTGFQVWNVRRWRKAEGRRRWAENPREEWAWSRKPMHPGIFTIEEFDTLWARFQGRKHTNARVRRQLLAGLLKCGLCGSGFVISSRKKKNGVFSYLVCGKKTRQGWASCETKAVPMQLVEETVQEEILALLTDTVYLKEFFSGVNEWTSTKDDRLEDKKHLAEKERAKLQAEIGNYSKAIAAAGVHSFSLVNEIARREKRIEQLALATSAASNGTLVWNDDDLEGWAVRLRAVYFASDLDIKRSVLGHMIREIIIDKNKSGRIVFDPTALLTLRNVWPDLPAELPVRIKTGCGGWI